MLFLPTSRLKEKCCITIPTLNKMADLTDYDKHTIIMALERRIHSLWSIEQNQAQRELYVRYKVLFEQLGGDYNRNYEREFLREKY